MSSIFYRILDWTRLLFGVLPKSGFGSARVFLIVHYTFIVLTALILAIFSPYIRAAIPIIDVRMPGLHPFLDRIWCGIAFLVIYAIIRIVLYLMELMGIEDASEFPNIEEDWYDILEALDRERLPIDDIPLFLVNGLTPQQEESAFESSSNIEWKVIAPPLNQKSAVIRAYANDDAIFLCCSGISATNYQQGKVSGDSGSTTVSRSPAAATGVTGTRKAGDLKEAVDRARSVPGTGTVDSGEMMAPGMTGTQPSVVEDLPRMGGFFGTIAPGGLQRAMQTCATMRSSDVKGYGKKRLAPLNDLELMLAVRQIHFLCSLIIEARRPFCPINGMLQAFPYSWTEDVEYSRKLVPAIREDVIAFHERLQLQFPLVAVVTELDDLSGMREFILRAERLQPGLRLSRAGSSFAAGADVSDAHAAWLIDRSMHWFRGWIYGAFAHDMENRDNQKLFNMLCAVNQRRKALALLLRESLYKVVNPQPRLMGCYFCATGHSSTEQGFLRGVLDKLPQSQGEVAYTPQFIRSQQRATNLAWGFLISGCVLSVATIVIFLSIGEAG